MTVMSVLVVAIAVAGLLAMLVVRRDWAEPLAVGLTLGLQILVPSFGPSQLIRAATVAVSVACLLLAFVRREPSSRSTNFPLLAVIFIGYLTWGNLLGEPARIVAYWALIGLVLILSAILIADANERVRRAVRAVLLISIPIEFAVSVAEQLQWITTAWPRGDSSDDIADRAHQFLPLIGRSEGTTGHPILLGTVSAVGVLVAIWSMKGARRPILRLGSLLLAAMALGTGLLSGTRSALVTLAGCLLLWFVTARAIPLVVRGCTLIGAGLLGYRQLLRVATDLIDSVRGTTSFEHRFGVLGNIPRLLARHGSQFWFGYGGGLDVGTLFQTGAIAGSDQLSYFDDQWVRLLAVSGVVGVLLCMAMLLIGLFRSDHLGRLLMVMLVVMFLSFDLFTWTLPTLLLVLAVAGPLGSREPRHEPVTVRDRRRLPTRRAWEYGQ